MGWVRFWGKCLRWAFTRVDKATSAALTTFYWLALITPIAALQKDFQKALTGLFVPWWATLLPIGVLFFLIAPYMQYRESERKREELEDLYDEEEFHGEFDGLYLELAEAFINHLRRFYRLLDTKLDLDTLLTRASHPSESLDPELIGFARAIYRKTDDRSPIGLRTASPILIHFETYDLEEFERVQREIGALLARWLRLSDGPLARWIVNDALHRAPHENVVKALGYIQTARAEVFGYPENLFAEPWWILGREWASGMQLGGQDPSRPARLPSSTRGSLSPPPSPG